MSDQAVVTLKDVDVEFHGKTRSVHAVDHVNLTVNRGDIYGIVGYSGAGKSTLVRTINLLQRPTSGSVNVLGQDMLALSAAQLRKERKRIGMIFQHFNLMNSRTIADNVAFPLKGIKSKQEIKKKVAELLDLVGLTDRANSYPAQLSGGQKQRVGIARALASDPEILISDEATSALDPKTTSSILDLLKSLNERLGLTIVLITHQMEAVKQICNRVAVMDAGAIIERGDLLQVFSNPKQQLTKDFIDTTLQLDQAIESVLQQPAVKNLGPNDRLLRLTYVGVSADQPLVAKLFESYQVTANILFGDIQILQDTPFGNLIVVLSGDQAQVDAGIQYLKQQDVKIEDILKKEA
ncbi:methionine ABC transporter ATP-binding protein [Lacticaseibacillus zeae]|uniref:ATP-binding cassette domain-containing protein n=1 Tax=Lacticaseibacillus zeae subsp. silagei TaxID=3068307 RepID=A0ABD7ZC70_LACZE|nr:MULTISPECIES: ATP-binding cassette domain-containing protein [Lacticaseibacillus]MDE3314936.1 ATP-binding cassette domain-containing protein [Lacticaseibacillus zeae]OFR95888.1 methionine ABC transporter ATP-binding protein [Lactobacillus sp. HMSC068F07]WLV84721.1 ATP-binding cassette domain-containing protein [Lacticaseibacillus sp. NCIMB 15475]WLV85489.1 ATP-binding cassette domain-containing protein [Lacticaseibacillus sp. NCIMB 15474]